MFKGVCDELFSGFAQQACERIGLNVNNLHLDATSFHVDGKCYEEASEAVDVIHLKQGYNRNHRPDSTNCDS